MTNEKRMPTRPDDPQARAGRAAGAIVIMESENGRRVMDGDEYERETGRRLPPPLAGRWYDIPEQELTPEQILAQLAPRGLNTDDAGRRPRRLRSLLRRIAGILHGGGSSDGGDRKPLAAE